MFYAHLTLFFFVLLRSNCNRIHYNIHIKFCFLFLFLQFENGFPFFFFTYFCRCVFLELHATTTMTNKKIRFTCKNHKNLIYTFVYLIRSIYSINFISLVLWIANCHWISKSLSLVINYGFSCSCSCSLSR